MTKIMQIFLFIIIMTFLIVPLLDPMKKSSSIQYQLSTIKESDKEDLKLLFEELVSEDQFGYTLFGDKPVSIAGYFLDSYLVEIACRAGFYGAPSHPSLVNLWKIWEQHQGKFNIQRFILLKNEDEGFGRITLINKTAFIECVRDHLDDFCQILGSATTPESLLCQLNTPHANLFEVLKKNEVLYGILLGFGKENAFLFKRRSDLLTFTGYGNPPQNFCYYLDSLYCPKPTPPFISQVEELNFLDEKCYDFSKIWPTLSAIDLPTFIADKTNPETEEIIEKYRKLHRELIKIYSEGDFLVITLDQLCKQ